MFVAARGFSSGRQVRCCTAQDAPASVLVEPSKKENLLDGTAFQGLHRLGSFNKKKCTWSSRCYFFWRGLDSLSQRWMMFWDPFDSFDGYFLLLYFSLKIIMIHGNHRFQIQRQCRIRTNESWVSYVSCRFCRKPTLWAGLISACLAIAMHDQC